MTDDDLFLFIIEKLELTLSFQEAADWFLLEDWQWFRKGLIQFAQEGGLLDLQFNRISLRMAGAPGCLPFYEEQPQTIDEIPRAFWMCWYRLEKESV